jgi:leishmanolysin
MIWDYSNTKCGEVLIPATDKTVKRDSDLHLYISYKSDPNSSYLAYAGWCRMIKGIGSTHG